MNTKYAIFLCLGLSIMGAPLSAQEKPVEFGADAGLSFVSWDESDSEGVTIFGLPGISSMGLAAVRMGFFATPRISIEPAFGLARMSTDESSSTVLHLFPSVLYHFKDFGRDILPYARAGAGLIHQRSSYEYSGGSESDSETQFGLGGGLGVKIPIAKTAFVRLEGGFEKWLEKGNQDDYEDYAPGFKIIRLSVGISAIIN